MAASKLTLSVDKDTIQMAKEFASEDNVSVSKLFKTLINEIATQRQRKDPLLKKYKDIKLSSKILALTGVIKGKYPENMDYKDMKYEYLKERYDL